LATVLDYYEILGVSSSSEQEVIDAAYRALMKKYHPDRFRGQAGEADGRAKLINEAYETLRDPGRRQTYDRAAATPPYQASEPGIEERPSADQDMAGERQSSVAAGEAAARAARRQGYVLVGVLMAVLILIWLVNPGG
jgi:curved DNA-binding protein CbpA